MAFSGAQSRASRGSRVNCWSKWVFFLIAACATTNRAFGGAPGASNTEAEHLVAAAAEAATSGDVAKSTALFEDAVRIDPDNRLARWQLGEIWTNKEWLKVEEAQHRASIDPRQAEYQERSAAVFNDPQGQLALAKWCRRNNFNDEARVHWANVLSIDPKNEEALRALGLRWHKGQLLSNQQAAQSKEESREAKRAAERWESKLVKWRRVIAGNDAAAREAALAEIRAIGDASAIPVLEVVTLGRPTHDAKQMAERLAFGPAVVEALGKMAGPQATESLARHAVFSPDMKTRAPAIEQLKPRDQYEFVPLLLSSLGMPIESSYRVSTGPDGSVRYTHKFFREGQDSDWSLEKARSAVQQDFGGTMRIDLATQTVQQGPPSEPTFFDELKKGRVTSTYQNRYSSEAVTAEQQVASANAATRMLNDRIIGVLAATTEKNYGDNPKAWWQWWEKQNEYYAKDHPVERYYDTTNEQYTYGSPTYEYYRSDAPKSPPPSSSSELRIPIPSGIPRMSCFVKGTPIWTKTGLQPIELLSRGDLVLSQNVDTGELKYEPVISLTLRPKSEILRISVGREELKTTKGHPFWVAGTGWRMAKELGDGAVLSGLHRASKVQSIEPAGEAEAYNLVVAEFNTYFVGNSGILVHDNTPRRPTQAVLPGILKK